ncbi:YbaK/EbsC family protein [Polymorphum gilvum]|uniref:YbaK/prolyl-tRNA synthetase associated region n=1 Tax=Polymorphum gilvum (strain LMG 25793 / CGMCC 1.9160 / SL003B-26A1) TaxID=991905 RepID=F2IW69_POLGS|nr:YbaK/EbsC family protein [Polymorphum gilvum]ADZ71454.1 YbaK/prolyl-tRNA synthetase associated region [Polymorphum gilvum SL003B-26A1]
MGIDTVRQFFADKAPDIAIIEKDASTATVQEAADAHGVAPAQIAKTLSLQAGDEIVLVVARGDARLDNRKAKAAFGAKVKMLGLDVVEEITGHPVGGVCPFGLARPLKVYCDMSLKAFDVVIPAAGAVNAAVRIAPQRMAELTGATWIDVCREPEAQDG